jgi:hypothetical protein
MSGGGGGGNETTTTQQVPPELQGAFRNLGSQANRLIKRTETKPTFLGAGSEYRLQRGQDQLGLTGGIPGFDQNAFNTTLSTGGFVPFNADDLRAQNQGRSLAGGVDPALGQAGNIFQNNAGVGALQGINIGNERNRALAPLQAFESQALKGFTPRELQQFSPSELQALAFRDLQASSNPAFGRLQETSRGEFLDFEQNPYLRDAINAAQQPVIERFTQDIQPALVGQFGGGFGLGGSASINAQRRAALDLNRALSEQSTQAYAQQYDAERARQEQATQFLGQLDLSRASQLGQLQLGRAQGIDSAQLARAQALGQLGFNRASQLDANQLARATSLGDLGLGFTNAGISRGSALGSLENQRAQGLLGVGQERRSQELGNINLLSSIGQQQRAQQANLFDTIAGARDAQIDDPIRRLGQISQIIGANPGGTTTQNTSAAGRNQLTGALGGAATGGALGFGVGGVPGSLIGAGLGGLGGFLQ